MPAPSLEKRGDKDAIPHLASPMLGEERGVLPMLGEEGEGVTPMLGERGGEEKLFKIGIF